jgi:hypothetical protein
VDLASLNHVLELAVGSANERTEWMHWIETVMQQQKMQNIQ